VHGGSRKRVPWAQPGTGSRLGFGKILSRQIGDFRNGLPRAMAVFGGRGAAGEMSVRQCQDYGYPRTGPNGGAGGEVDWPSRLSGVASARTQGRVRRPVRARSNKARCFHLLLRFLTSGKKGGRFQLDGVRFPIRARTWPIRAECGARTLRMECARESTVVVSCLRAVGDRRARQIPASERAGTASGCRGRGAGRRTLHHRPTEFHPAGFFARRGFEGKLGRARLTGCRGGGPAAKRLRPLARAHPAANAARYAVGLRATSSLDAWEIRERGADPAGEEIDGHRTHAG